MLPFAAPPIKTCRSSWQVPRHRSKVGVAPARRIPARRYASPRAQSPDARRTHNRPPQRSPQQELARRNQPTAPSCHGGSPPRRWPGDPAPKSPRPLHPHPMPLLRPHRRLPRLRNRANVPPPRRHRRLPLLRFSNHCPQRLPRVQLPWHPLQRPGHAKTRSRSPRPLSESPLPAHGYRHHARPRQPRSKHSPVFAKAATASSSARR